MSQSRRRNLDALNRTGPAEKKDRKQLADGRKQRRGRARGPRRDRGGVSRGRDQLQEVMKQLGPIAKMENPPRMEGRFLSMIVIGDREAIAEAKRLEETERAAEKTEEEGNVSQGTQEMTPPASEQTESEEEAPQAAE